MKSTRIPIAAGSVAILMVGTWLVLRTRTLPDRPDATSPVVEQSIPVTLETAAFVAVPQYLDATGTVHAELEAPIATKVQGRVTAIFVREGDRVRRGQPLLQLDARDLDAGVAQAQAGVRSASVGYENSKVAAAMEQSVADARIAQAEAGVSTAEAAVQSARARYDMVQTGPRRQERSQAALAVIQAKAGLTLAQNNLTRMKALYADGAISHAQLDTYQSQYDVSKAQWDTTVEGQSIADEGSRSEDIRSAKEGVRMAEAGLAQSRAALKQARAAAKQADVRRAEIRGAQAMVSQGRAALDAARVMRDYATINAPFDGIVTKRSVDPGALASPGVPLLTVQGGDLRIEAVVPEGVLASVHPNSVIPVMLDALPGKPLSGRVVEIAPQGDASSHTFVVKVRLSGGVGERSGMFGRARFATGTTRQILVPVTGVTVREGLSYLYISDGTGHARLRLVTVGDTSGERVPVLSGLNAGEHVVINSGAVTDGAHTTEGKERS